MMVGRIRRLTMACMMMSVMSLQSAEHRQDDARVPLWPEGCMPYAAESGNPYLEWCDAPASNMVNGACMILICGENGRDEGEVMAVECWKTRFTALGYRCVCLVCRIPCAIDTQNSQAAWADGQRAVRMVRREAARRGYDPERIGVIGRSAGAYLGCMLSTSSQTTAYERIDELDDVPCGVSWVIADELPSQFYTAFRFDAKTCPISFHHDGGGSSAQNGSIFCYRELRKMNIPAELHIDSGVGCYERKIDRAVEFMHQMNFDGWLKKSRELDYVLRQLPDGTLRTEKENLWPEGKMPDVCASQFNEPYLVWFIPEKCTTTAIQIIIPGGGYYICNFNQEGAPVAYYLNEKGMAAVVVTYRYPRPTGKPKHFSALQDTQRAIRMVRSEAAARGFDPNRIGLMGFSAGGHLTLLSATGSKTKVYEPIDEIDKLSCAVQWACPIYPAYVLTDGEDGYNSTRGNADYVKIVPELLFDEDTPPMCFLHGDSDAIASTMGSVKCWEKLQEMGVHGDIHTLATRGHCFQIHGPREGTGSWNWMDRVWDFISKSGFDK